MFARPIPMRAVFIILGATALVACGANDKRGMRQPKPSAAPTAPDAPAEPEAEPNAPPVLGSQSPAPADKQRSVEVTNKRVQAGKALYATCVGCHGDNAVGRIGIGPRISSETYMAAASDAFLMDTIAKGRAGTTMPAWGTSLSDDQIASLVAYLRSLHPSEPAKLDHTPAQGNVANGRAVFRDICSGCHGRHGAGYQETANGTGIGRKAFLDTAPDGFIRYIVKHGKTLTQMKGFDEKDRTAVANLSDKQVNDTIAYLRANAW